MALDELPSGDNQDPIKLLPPPIQKIHKTSKKIYKMGLVVISIIVLLTVLIAYKLNEDELIDKEIKQVANQVEENFGEEYEISSYTELSLNIRNELLFDYDKSELNKITKTKLDSISSKINDDMTVEVVGHTDNDGDDCYNYRLSRERAETVYKYIHSIIDPNESRYYGLGEDFPKGNNNTDFGKSKNRRVELRIIKKDENNLLSFQDGLAKKVAFYIKNNPIAVMYVFK